MALPILLGLAAAVPQIIGGVVANRSHRKLADEMEGMTMEMPSGMTEAEKLYRQIAGSGMPGYEKAQTDIAGTVSQNLNSYRDVVDNPAQLLGALSDSQTNVNSALSDLAVKDAMFKLQNEGNLASFLSGPKANAEMSIEQYNNQMKLGAGQERQAGTAELLKGITGGVAGGITGFSTGKMLDAQKGAFDAWNVFMKNGTTPAGKTGTDALMDMLKFTLPAGAKSGEASDEGKYSQYQNIVNLLNNFSTLNPQGNKQSY